MFRGQMNENRGGRLFNGKWVGTEQVAELFSGIANSLPPSITNKHTSTKQKHS